MSIERFPEIAFQLKCGEFAPRDVLWRGRGLVGELGDVDVLYVVGLENVEVFEEVRGWLEGDRRRVVVFWEEELAVVDACVRGPWAEEVLGCGQVHLEVGGSVREVAARFPFARVEVVGGDEGFREEVKQWHLVTAGLVQEALHGHRLGVHVVRNMKRVVGAACVGRWKGAFAGVPAVVCGAGPSLERDLEGVRVFGERGVVIAGGSALAVLGRAGVEPHVGVAVDPNLQEVRCLEGMRLERAPLVFTHRLFPEVFELGVERLGFVKTCAGGRLERWVERELGIDGEVLETGELALSVTTLGLALAVEMGCNPIVLVGVDLAYTGGKRYAAGVGFEGAVDGELVQKGDVITKVQWVAEGESVSAFAKEHGDLRIVNASGGLEMEGIEQVELGAFLGRERVDVWGRIEELLAETVLGASEKDVERVLGVLRESVERARGLCEELREAKGGIRALYECELEGELIYQLVLEEMGRAVEIVHGDKWELFLEALEAIGDAVLFELVAQGAHADA